MSIDIACSACYGTGYGIDGKPCPCGCRAAAQAPTCRHRIADARNPVVTSGYICIDCGAVFAAADHDPLAPTPAAAEGQEPAAPHILEALSYHANERDDMTLEEAVEAFRYGWKKVRGRSEREMLAQLICLMASAPAEVATPLPRQAAVQGDTDAKRLDDLETLCWSQSIGNGLVLWAGTKNMEGERKQLYWVQDMGDEDGSNLGDQIGEGVTLRAAIDQAIAAMATAGKEAK